ncbi:hypothetical protein VE03_06880 [Pseudogymnoascus sp. 23342-1-I1]|nr:hypothetical protein VE03_06880 [Pseudogymnoascus sp. 23342-1-I1]
MESTSALPPTRRIVTGHNDQGRAIIESDTVLYPIPPQPTTVIDAEEESHLSKFDQASNGGFIMLWRTNEFPAAVQGPWTEYHGKPIPLADDIGATVRIVDMPPGLRSPMHRTKSLDFGVVLSGEVILVLDDGVESIVKQGETVVQRGTIHAWENRTTEITRVLFVLLPSKEVIINGRALGKTNFGVN